MTTTRSTVTLFSTLLRLSLLTILPASLTSAILSPYGI